MFLDILLELLSHVRHSDLPALCLLNKELVPYVQSLIFRSVDYHNSVDACIVLLESPRLAKLVRHFKMTNRTSMETSVPRPPFQTVRICFSTDAIPAISDAARRRS